MTCPFSTFPCEWGPDVLAHKGEQRISGETFGSIRTFFRTEQVSAKGLVGTMTRGLPSQLALRVSARIILRTDGASPLPYLQIEVLGLMEQPALWIVIGFYRLNSELILEAGLIQLHEQMQGQGWGSVLVRNLADVADVLSVSAIQFQAGMSVGGYAWARFGGVPVDPAAFAAMLKERLARSDDGSLTAEDHAARVQLGVWLDEDGEQFVQRLPTLLSGQDSMAGVIRGCLLGSTWMGYWEPGNPQHRAQLAAALNLRKGGT